MVTDGLKRNLLVNPTNVWRCSGSFKHRNHINHYVRFHIRIRNQIDQDIQLLACLKECDAAQSWFSANFVPRSQMWWTVGSSTSLSSSFLSRLSWASFINKRSTTTSHSISVIQPMNQVQLFGRNRSNKTTSQFCRTTNKRLLGIKQMLESRKIECKNVITCNPFIQTNASKNPVETWTGSLRW